MPTDPARFHTDGYLTDGAKDDTDQGYQGKFLEIERSDSHGDGIERKKWLGRRKVGDPRPLSESEVLPQALAEETPVDLGGGLMSNLAGYKLNRRSVDTVGLSYMEGDTSMAQITSGSEMPLTTIVENKLRAQTSGRSKHSKGFNSAFDDMYLEAFKAPNLSNAHNEYVPVGQGAFNEMRDLNHGKRETAGNRLLNAFVRQIKGVDFLGDQPNLKFPIKNADTPPNFSMDCQILKSAGNWSLGLKDEMTENSIHLAYIELIKNAQHFIYIENQFFVSGHSDPIVSNQITNALFSKIKDKILKDEKFKVIIVLPLRPGFEGEFDAKESSTVKICLGWHQSTINKDKGSL